MDIVVSRRNARATDIAKISSNIGQEQTYLFCDPFFSSMGDYIFR
jgi:hypothetical protein